MGKGQREFARRLREAMDAVNAQGLELAREAAVTPNTISRWRNDNYDSGPPSQAGLRNLEPALGLARGVLLGSPERWEVALKMLKDARSSRARNLQRSGKGAGGRVSEPPEGPGWMWGDPSEAEEQFRAFIQHIEYTVRGMVGDPKPEESLRKLRLAACRAAMESAELAGRPVPRFVQDVYNEVIGGSFRP